MNKIAVIGGLGAAGVIATLILRKRSSANDAEQVSYSDPTLAYLAAASVSPTSSGLVTAADNYGVSDASYTQPVGDSEAIQALKINAGTQQQTTSSGLFAALSSMVTGGVSAVKATFGTDSNGKTTIDFSATPIPQVTPIIPATPSGSTPLLPSPSSATSSSSIGLMGGAANLWDNTLNDSQKLSALRSLGFNGPVSAAGSFISSAGLSETQVAVAVMDERRRDVISAGQVKGQLSNEQIEAQYGSRPDIQSARNQDPNFNLAQWYQDFGRYGM